MVNRREYLREAVAVLLIAGLLIACLLPARRGRSRDPLVTAGKQSVTVSLGAAPDLRAPLEHNALKGLCAQTAA